jgi:hypothetical protein
MHSRRRRYVGALDAIGICNRLGSRGTSTRASPPNAKLATAPIKRHLHTKTLPPRPRRRATEGDACTDEMSKTGQMPLSRLLVGDDGSPGAVAARTWARALAGAARAEVVVATVVPLASVGQGVAQARPTGTRELTGAPATALLAFAEEIAADLVVVGRRGAGGFEALRLGAPPIRSPSTLPGQSRLFRRPAHPEAVGRSPPSQLA